jgi:hypothetical protein
MDTEQLELPLEGISTRHPAARELRRARRWVVTNSNRAKFIEALYARDGRQHRDHPRHGCYTGLAQEFFRALGEAVAQVELALPDCQISDLLDAPSSLRAALSLATDD